MTNPRAAELLASAAKRLRARFQELREANLHRGEQGREAQNVLIDFLNDYLPKRFRATSGYILESQDDPSRHFDVILYDQLDALVFSPASGSLIIPNDNVAAVIEVKSTLNKKELEDAAETIARAKQLAKHPESPTDFALGNSGIQITTTRGIVFAYSADTELTTLAANLRAINARHDSEKWIDEVVVLDVGGIAYWQFLPESGTQIIHGGISPDAIPFPIWIVPMVYNASDAVLPTLMGRLAFHLANYRRRPSMRFDRIIPQVTPLVPLAAYQLNTGRRLVEDPLSPFGPSPTFAPRPTQCIRFIDGANQVTGTAEWFPWADGHVWRLALDKVLAPGLVKSALFKPYRMEVNLLPASRGIGWTQILPGSEPPDFARTIDMLTAPTLPFRIECSDNRTPPPVTG